MDRAREDEGNEMDTMDTGPLWGTFTDRWHRAMADQGITLEIKEVDAVLEDPSDFHTVWSGRGTWWKRETAAAYPVVNWKDGIGALVMGDPGYATRTSVDFPRQPSGVRQIGRLMSRIRNDAEAMIAAMVVASDEQHSGYVSALGDLADAAHAVLANRGIEFRAGANCDRFLPYRNDTQIPPDRIDHLIDWVVAEHVETLRRWTPVDFRGWLIEDGAYREVTDDESTRSWYDGVRTRMDERTARREGRGEKPQAPVTRKPRKGDEALLREAIGEYLAANGIKGPQVEFGVHSPTEMFNIAYRIEGGKVSIIRSSAPGERNQRGVRWSRTHTTEAVLKGEGDARLRTIRALVHKSLHSYVGHVWRIFALRTVNDGDGDDIREPLWSMDVHPYARALHPDLTRIFRINPENVKPENPYQPCFDMLKERTWGHIRPDGTLLEMRDVEIAPGMNMNQDKTGTYLTISRGFTEEQLACMKGRDAADLPGMPALPAGITVRTAQGGKKWTRLKIDDAVVPAADLPDGIDDWRGGGMPPEEWGACAEARLVKPRRERTPIAHAVGRKWTSRKTAAPAVVPRMQDEFAI